MGIGAGPEDRLLNAFSPHLQFDQIFLKIFKNVNNISFICLRWLGISTPEAWLSESETPRDQDFIASGFQGRPLYSALYSVLYIALQWNAFHCCLIHSTLHETHCSLLHLHSIALEGTGLHCNGNWVKSEANAMYQNAMQHWLFFNMYNYTCFYRSERYRDFKGLQTGEGFTLTAFSRTWPGHPCICTWTSVYVVQYTNLCNILFCNLFT